jgi:hypothetical protein
MSAPKFTYRGYEPAVPPVTHTVAPLAPGWCAICITGRIEEDGYCSGCGYGARQAPPPLSLMSRTPLVCCSFCAKPFHRKRQQGQLRRYCSIRCQRAAFWDRQKTKHIL